MTQKKDFVLLSITEDFPSYSIRHRRLFKLKLNKDSKVKVHDDDDYYDDDAKRTKTLILAHSPSSSLFQHHNGLNEHSATRAHLPHLTNT
jgi:hypothetical protein